MIRRTLVVIALLLACGLAPAQSDTGTIDPVVDASRRVVAALEAQRRGDPPSATEWNALAMELAALDGARMATDGGDPPAVGGAEFQRTLGTLWHWGGDDAKAVLAFRRSLELDPSNTKAREALEVSRAALRDGGVSTGPPGLRARFTRLLSAPPGWVWPALLVLGWWIGWGCVTLGRWRAVAVWAFTIGAVGAIGLAVPGLLRGPGAPAVVIEPGVIARNGPGAGLYPPTFDEPLPSGEEVLVYDTQMGWSRLRLRSGQQTWVPSSAIERVQGGF